MKRFLVVAWLGCGSSKRAEPPPPAPVVASADAARPDAATLSPALLARWQNGCFMLGTLVSDATRCAKPRRPYSTFKVPNALIALDAGVLAGPDAPMTWDKKAVPDQDWYLDAWRKPHTLRSGIKVSAVPHFRTLARTIGEARMKAGLAKLRYGNQAIGGKLDEFWLARGDLLISAADQLAFVDALAHGKLDVSAKAQEVVREITILETAGDKVLHGKTGSGPIEHGNGGWLVWQVGWIERGKAIVPYAVWLELSDPKSSIDTPRRPSAALRGPAEPVLTIDTARAAREEALRESLRELGAFP